MSAASQEDKDVELARDIFFNSSAMNINEHIESMTDMLISRQPEWEKYRELIRDKVEGILLSDSYQVKISKIISKNFNHEDLVQLSEIMSQPVMVKWNKTSHKFWPQIAMETTDHVLPLVGDLVNEITVKERTISDYQDSGDEGKRFTRLIRNNRCDELQTYADEVLRKAPDNIEALYSKGYCYHKGLSYSKAEQLFSMVYEQDSEYRRINYNLAQLYLDIGEYRQALKYAIDETNLHPEDPDTFMLLAFLHLKNNDKTKACESFKEAEAINPRVASYQPKIEACSL